MIKDLTCFVRVLWKAIVSFIVNLRNLPTINDFLSWFLQDSFPGLFYLSVYFGVVCREAQDGTHKLAKDKGSNKLGLFILLFFSQCERSMVLCLRQIKLHALRTLSWQFGQRLPLLSGTHAQVSCQQSSGAGWTGRARTTAFIRVSQHLVIK